MLAQILSVALLAAVSGHPPSYSSGRYEQPTQEFASQPLILHAEPEPYHNIDYNVNWAVQDENTFNYQTREESKTGERVQGSYTVQEPDGNLRTVTYVADKDGFVADVQNKPGHGAPYQAPPATFQTSNYERPAMVMAAPARYELPKAPKYEAPKYQAPKYEAPKLVMAPVRYELHQAPAKLELQKYEAPKYEAPKYEAPKYEAPPRLQEAPQQFSYQQSTQSTYGTYQPAAPVQVFSSAPRPAAPKPMPMSAPAKPTYTASAEMVFRPQPAPFQQQQQQQHGSYGQQAQLESQAEFQQEGQSGQSGQSGYDNQQPAAEPLTSGKY